MANLKIGVFGCGNMGRALVLGIKARHPLTEFFLFTPSHIKAQELARNVHGSNVEKVQDMPKDLDWYILAFKPQNLNDFHFEFTPASKILSVLAGVPVLKLVSKFGSNSIARLMPNTPSSIGLGANLLYLDPAFRENEKLELVDLLSATGTVFPMASENDLDLATAFSGSGPALLFELARIFESELYRMTQGRVPAREIVARTFLGSASLMNEFIDVGFEELRNQVTSKKGVTNEALSVLNENNLEGLFKRAFEAAYRRTQELSQE